MKKIEPLDIAKWGIVVVGGVVVYRILRATGILKSYAEMQQSNLTAANELLVENAELQDWTKPNFFNNPPAGYEKTPNSPSALNDWVVAMKDTTGFFNDNEEAMRSLLFKIKTKDTYSQLANYFSLQYGEDLTSWLKDNYSVSELAPCFAYLNTLPTFSKK